MKPIILGLLMTCGLWMNAQLTKEQKKMEKELIEKLQDGLYAKMSTTEGDLWIQFYEKESPVTVANFIALAEGTKEGMNKPKGTKFYDGTIFHRVIKDFMIQGGDPQGTGMGDPGYRFADEQNDLKHSGKGILSMANSGPNTNGSQFFITEVATPWLDGKHTIFGKVIRGLEVIDKIANTPKGGQDKPIKDIKINSVVIHRVGKQFKKYDANLSFNTLSKTIQKRNEDRLKKEKEAREAKLKDMQVTASGLKYKILNKGTGAKAEKGKTVSVHYTGMLEDGVEFDSSVKRGQPIDFPLGNGMVIPGWEEGIALLSVGDKALFWIPSSLGYGTQGAGGVIPPNANLIFEVELMAVK